jgi:hypothetical protein
MIETRHDTIDKVNQALTKLGWTEPQVIDAINEMLNLGVVFAERVKDDDDEMTPEEQAAWDALTPEEQVAIAFAPIEVLPLPEISIKRGGLRWDPPNEVTWIEPIRDYQKVGNDELPPPLVSFEAA